MKQPLIKMLLNNKEVNNITSIVFGDDYFIFVTLGKNMNNKNENRFILGKKYNVKININGIKTPLSNDMFYLKKLTNDAHETISGLLPITYKYFFYKV